MGYSKLEGLIARLASAHSDLLDKGGGRVHGVLCVDSIR